MTARPRTLAGLLAWLGLAMATVALAQPTPRGYVQMAYDSESELIVLFGGQVAPVGTDDSVSGETWILDPTNGSWEQRTPNPAPPARGAANLVYDAAADRIVLWGGVTQTNALLTDLWTYDTNTDTWAQQAQQPADGPGGRIGPGMAYDPQVDSIVLFGGYDHTFLGDTWILDPNDGSWVAAGGGPSPDARNFFGMAYDPTTARVDVWGGSYLLDTVWSFDTANQAWAQEDPIEGAPTPRD